MLTVILCLNLASFVLALVMLRQEWRRLTEAGDREGYATKLAEKLYRETRS